MDTLDTTSRESSAEMINEIIPIQIFKTRLQRTHRTVKVEREEGVPNLYYAVKIKVSCVQSEALRWPTEEERVVVVYFYGCYCAFDSCLLHYFLPILYCYITTIVHPNNLEEIHHTTIVRW